MKPEVNTKLLISWLRTILVQNYCDKETRLSVGPPTHTHYKNRISLHGKCPHDAYDRINMKKGCTVGKMEHFNIRKLSLGWMER